MEVVVSPTLRGARAVVIGAGPAGLAAALGLAVRGARVRVLESREEVESLDNGPEPIAAGDGAWVFPAGELDVLMPNLIGSAFALADLRLSDFVRFTLRDPAVQVWNSAEGKYLGGVRSRQDLAVAVGNMNPAVSARFSDFTRSADAVGRALEDGWLAAGGFPWWGGSPRRWRAYAAAMRPRRAGKMIGRQVGDPVVAALWRAMAWRVGACPFRSSAGLRGFAAAALFRGAWMPEGGMAMMRNALRRVAEMKGVRIVTSATARKVEIDDRRVRRVTGDGFRPLRADVVVSTLGVRGTASRLLAEGDARRWLEGRRTPAQREALTLFLGVRGAKTPADLAPVWIPAADPAETHRQRDGWRVPPAEAEFLVERVDGIEGGKAPEGCAALRVTVPQPPASERWRWNDRNLATVRDTVVSRMEKAGFQNLDERIQAEHAELPGPQADERPRRDGRWTWARQPGPRVRGARGLYLAGPGVHPGRGLTFEVLAGLLAAEAAGCTGA